MLYFRIGLTRLGMHALGVVLFLAVAIMALQAGVVANAQEGEATSPQTKERLDWMREHQTGMWNVAPREGVFLHDLVVKVRAKNALEIGTANGYSGIWIAAGLRETGGHLLTLEIDPGRASLAQENFRAAGVEKIVSLKLGDALQEVPSLQGPFEFVFIDASKEDYVKYLHMVLPLVPAGGVILAHNVTDLRAELQDFINEVQTNPELKTRIENPGPGGFSVSYKRAK